jgi:alkylation response protein AidB-like acyl-CoA dehydrogenase
MNFALTPEQEEIRALARDFAEREVAPVIHHFDELHEFPHEIMTRLAGTGLLGALGPASTTSRTRSRWRS